MRLDLNNPHFQQAWFALDTEDRIAVLNACVKLSELDWNALYSHRGFRWEAIHARTGPGGERLYSIRITRKFRAVGRRNGEWLRLISLHPDHDSAY